MDDIKDAYDEGKVKAELKDSLLMWQPTHTEDHELNVVRKAVNKQHGTRLQNYWDLHQWSVENYDKFWDLMWRHLGIVASEQPIETLTNDAMDKIPKWFPGARLNYAENLLRHQHDDKLAMYFTSERIHQTGIGKRTFGELKRNVAAHCGVASSPGRHGG